MAFQDQSRISIERDFCALTWADMAQIGFLEIGLDAGSVIFDHRYHRHAGKCHLSDLQPRDLSGDAVRGRAYDGARQIQFGSRTGGARCSDAGVLSGHLAACCELRAGLGHRGFKAGGINMDQNAAGGVLNNAAYFGAKDWQQTLVIKRMVRDLGLPIEIVVCPTLREADGLAMSSRNAYLTAADRPRAVALSESLRQAEQLWAAGADAAAIERMMRETMEARGIAVDYAAVANPESLEPLAADAVQAVALVAGRLGTTRLIDNRELRARGPFANRSTPDQAQTPDQGQTR